MPASCDCATAVLGLREAPGGTSVLVFVLRCVGSKVDSKTKLAALSFCCGWELPLPPLKHLSRIPYCLLTLPKLITRQRAGYLPSVKLSKALPATPELGAAGKHMSRRQGKQWCGSPLLRCDQATLSRWRLVPNPSTRVIL